MRPTHAAPAILAVWLAATACGSSSEPSTEPLVHAGAPETNAPDAVGPRPNLRILFVGNSYTFGNDVPGILTRIAATSSTGPTITAEMVALGGAKLRHHWDGTTNARARIAEKTWTHVVFQGQSQEPTGSGRDGFLTHARLLGDAATEAGARATWFVTWAYGGDAHMQDALTWAYADAARSVPGSLLGCAGEAFRASLRDHPEIALQGSDGSHATLAGSYLAASTFYVALTGTPLPSASEVPAGLDANTASSLRSAANVGSNCADVRPSADVTLNRDGYFQDDLGNTAIPGDFGTSVAPVARTLYLHNGGIFDAGLTPSSLSPPFAWPSGAYPGGAGVDPGTGLPYCTGILPAGASCALALRYDATSTSTSTLTLTLSNAYQTAVVETLIGRTTDRAHLDLRRPNPRNISLVTTGTSSPVFAVLSNTGARPASSIVMNGLEAPFSWGGAGVFPGGAGTVDITGTVLSYCTTEIAPGERCALGFQFTAPQPQQFYTMPLSVTYASSASPAEPLVTDTTIAGIQIRSGSSAP